MDIWRLDLCKECKSLVMALLRDHAVACGRTLPDHGSEEIPRL